MMLHKTTTRKKTQLSMASVRARTICCDKASITNRKLKKKEKGRKIKTEKFSAVIIRWLIGPRSITQQAIREGSQF